MISFELYATSTLQNEHAAYYAYIRSRDDAMYLDSADGQLKPFTDLVQGQHDFQEDVNTPGVWRLTVPFPPVSGTFVLLPYDGTTNFLVPSPPPSTFYVAEGERLADPALNQVALYEHYSGMNALQLVTEKGVPVEGARIRVYRKLDYDLRRLERLVSHTHTITNGYWAQPLFVPTGMAYTVVYDKPFEISTTTVEIIVPA